MDWANASGRMTVALITGASTGIGLATAERLLSEGVFVILTARKESLGRFSECSFLKKYPNHWVRPLDVRAASERRHLIDQIENEFGCLDILINNAAVIYRSPIEYTYEFEGKEQMLVNFHAPLDLIRCALPLIRKANQGHIINVSSAAGFLAMPSMGMYAASKHALEAASEALYHELKPWNISVTLIEPGFISSDAYLRARPSLAMERGEGAWAGTYWEQTNLISSLVERASHLSHSRPDDIADAISRVIENPSPPLHVVVTTDAKVFSFLKRFLPSRLFENLLSTCLGLMRIESPKDPPKLVDIGGPDSYSLYK